MEKGEESSQSTAATAAAAATADVTIDEPTTELNFLTLQGMRRWIKKRRRRGSLFEPDRCFLTKGIRVK